MNVSKTAQTVNTQLGYFCNEKCHPKHSKLPNPVTLVTSEAETEEEQQHF